MKWKVISELENYEVSELGQVRRIGKTKNLSQSSYISNTNKYYRVSLSKDGKKYYKQVHRLVAEAFIPNPLNLPQVDHLDNNGSNNKVNNLEWVSASENIKRSFNRNPKTKKGICAKGGKKAGKTAYDNMVIRLKNLLTTKLIKVYPANIHHKEPTVTYACNCGTVRTVPVRYREIRDHSGKCPVCTNSVNRSTPSLL